MKVDLKELIAALPNEDDDLRNEADHSEAELRQIFADLARRPVPIGSLHRMWTMSELSMQVALAYLAYWVRGFFVDADAKKKQLMETNLRVALKTIHKLGYLRGAATKLGQALGALPSILPEQIVSTLDRLHCEAPPMHFSLLRELVRNELGKDPEDLFAGFEKEAFAAASLGQVHRARLKSGEIVAVKIQYPGIARTIDADMRNLGALMFPARLGKDWEYTQAHFEEIHRMLKLEVDYEREAETMGEVAALFAPDDGIVVPRVHPEYSTKHVLTTEFLAGTHLQEFLAADPVQSLRNHFGSKMYESWGRVFFANMNYADPHAGNYVFMSDGRLGLLDFGCVQHFTAEEIGILRMTERLVESFDHLPEVLKHCGVSEDQIADPEFLELMRESSAFAIEPIRSPGPFDFGEEAHLKRGVESFSRLVLTRRTQGHPMFVYWNRSLIGFRALMYQLRAQFDMERIYRQEKAIRKP